MLLIELTQYLAGLFTTAVYPADEQGGVFHLPNPDRMDQPVNRIGLALEPKPGLAEWIGANHLDVLWMHRPWKIDLAAIPTNVTVLYNHLPFDEHLTIGYNRWLADALGIAPESHTDLNEATYQAIGYKQAPDLPKRPIGLIGQGPGVSFEDWLGRVNSEFGGYDEARPGSGRLSDGVAIVGAMNDALIREAATQGVGLYITGQFRPSAQQALEETGMGLLAIGHQRSEEWGLRQLARLLESLPGIETVSDYQSLTGL